MDGPAAFVIPPRPCPVPRCDRLCGTGYLTCTACWRTASAGTRRALNARYVEWGRGTCTDDQLNESLWTVIRSVQAARRQALTYKTAPGRPGIPFLPGRQRWRRTC